MRAIVQRVLSASVEVEGRVVSEIGPGLLVLVLNMRLFPNEKTGKAWDQSGNKPDFHVAMPPQEAKPFYACLVEKFRKAYTADLVKGVLPVGWWKKLNDDSRIDWFQDLLFKV
ncbi:D-tyrosyl-tRNA(Tyr) deacylase 1 [Ananas comosus]|uniref:D-aminoacyl-tRNA deacylase n=1 Tax=Ananas comosus TaxID=4615 RepID=A0A199UWJ5_ANACO|nr:D-tyrosyl-tRNA(Tyr) deacylase 1 [Ananas comosus]